MITHQKTQIEDYISGDSHKTIVRNILNLADNIFEERKSVSEETDGWSPTLDSEAGSFFKSTVSLLKDVFSPVSSIKPRELHYNIQSKFDVFSLGAVMSYDLSIGKIRPVQ